MKVVEGVNISGYGHQELAQDLEMYCSVSPAARQHVRQAGGAGASIEVQRAGNICHADGVVVKISRDACLSEPTGLTSPIFMVESVLFELQNAINDRQYARLRRGARSGMISILQYGLGMSNLEFESTAKVVQILTQLRGAGKPISPWGQKQFAGYVLGPGNFANQPHDPNSSDERRLPSRLFYAYSYLQDTVKFVRNMKIELKNLAIVKRGTKSIEDKKWGESLVPNWDGAGYGTPAQFLVYYVDALLWLGYEVGWQVNWRGGTPADWKLCATEFVRTVPFLRHDKQATETIKKDIEGAVK